MPTNSYARKDALAQVFTPARLGTYMVSLLTEGMTHKDILSATFLEPSAGQGDLVLPLLDRMLQATTNEQYDEEETHHYLSNHLLLVEYDPDVIPHLRANLTAHALKAGTHMPEEAWNIHVGDALDFTPDRPVTHVLGNPPYIRVHDMPAEMRERVKAYALNTGTTDLYVTFFQLGLDWLTPTGRLVYVTPNSFLKNIAQRQFRELILEAGYLEHITDYRAKKVFPDAAAYVAVTVLQKPDRQKPATYTFAFGNEDGTTATSNSELPYPAPADRTKPLLLLTNDELTHLNAVNSRPNLMSTHAYVGNGTQTSRDKTFLAVTPEMVDEPATLPVVKASKHRVEAETQHVIFPYTVDADGRAIVMDEETLRISSPNVYQFLLSEQEDLLRRDVEPGVLWYQYGRSQGLGHIGKPKVAVAPLLGPDDDQVRAVILTEPTVIYRGMYVTPHPDSDMTVEELYQVITHPDFAAWARLTGKDMSGGWRSFNATTIKTYRW